MGLGALLGYWNVYLANLGFSALQIGQLGAVMAGARVVGPNVFGWLADRSGAPLQVIRLTTILTLIAFSGFFWRQDFAWVAWVSAAFSLFWSPVLPLAEALTLGFLQLNTYRYSRVRLWGSLGFIVALVVLGQAFEQIPITWLPAIIAGLLAAAALVSLSIRRGPPPHASHPLDGEHFWQLVRRPAVLAYLLVFFLLQISHGPYYNFFTLYLLGHGYTKAAAGWFWAIGVIAEILLFLAAHRLLRCFALRTLLLTSLMLSSLRWAMLGHAADSLTGLILAQLLHAASFGMCHLVAMLLAHRFFHGRNFGKGQALYSSMCFGLGGMLGSYYSGVLWEHFGPTAAFDAAAVIGGIAWLTAWISLRGSACETARPLAERAKISYDAGVK